MKCEAILIVTNYDLFFQGNIYLFMSVGKYVSNWRTENSKTMLELSTLSVIDQALISKYESGEKSRQRSTYSC